MNLSWNSAKVFVVPVLVGIYLILFWTNIASLPLNASGFPKLLILIIALLIVLDVAKEVPKLGRHASPPPADTALRSATGGAVTGPVDRDDVATTPLTLSERLATTPYRENVPMYAIIVFLIAYWLLLPVIGAYPSTAIFVAGLSVVLGYRKPLLIIVSTIICVAIVGFFIEIFTLPIAAFGS